MSEAYLEYLMETETDESVIWEAFEKFNDQFKDERRDLK